MLGSGDIRKLEALNEKGNKQASKQASKQATHL
jgi:hypothetical protein